MAMVDFEFVNARIDEEKDFLNDISKKIWTTPELAHKEFHAHDLLTNALESYGFKVQRQYGLQTAFRAEYTSKSRSGPTVAVLLEYDALPDIGHACGHNLIAEAGLAAAIAIKAVMENDASIDGKIVVLGTPAEETDGGKIKLLQFGAFDDVDAAMMVHPSSYTELCPGILCCTDGTVHFRGKEAHGASNPWDGINAQDAAVICYQNIALLRQLLNPSHIINVLITKCGTAVNVISSESSMDFTLRAPTMTGLKILTDKVKACIRSAAEATGCQETHTFQEEESFKNLLTNKVLMSKFKGYLKQLDYDFGELSVEVTPSGSTDMGNVSHKVPSIHPLYSIPATDMFHTKDFTSAAGDDTAQKPTLAVAKAMALTALYLMRNRESVEEAKRQLQQDLLEDLKRF